MTDVQGGGYASVYWMSCTRLDLTYLARPACSSLLQLTTISGDTDRKIHIGGGSREYGVPVASRIPVIGLRPKFVAISQPELWSAGCRCLSSIA